LFKWSRKIGANPVKEHRFLTLGLSMAYRWHWIIRAIISVWKKMVDG